MDVTAYTSNMLGVDRSDQLLSYFPIHRRSMKWWKKPFFHLLTLCMIQTHILLNKYRTGLGMKKLTLEDTVKSICTELPLTHVAEPERADDGPARPLRRIMPKDTHFMRVIPTLPGQRQMYRNCKVCYDRSIKNKEAQRKNQRKQVQYECSTCQVPLCVTPCFEMYHTKVDFALTFE